MTHRDTANLSYLHPPLLRREIDIFVKKLAETVEFFESLETSGSTEAGKDDFVPFV